eukprot:scaffold3103_cov136-Cylindrotheca_fusiformis.AAC.23
MDFSHPTEEELQSSNNNNNSIPRPPQKYHIFVPFAIALVALLEGCCCVLLFLLSAGSSFSVASNQYSSIGLHGGAVAKERLISGSRSGSVGTSRIYSSNAADASDITMFENATGEKRPMRILFLSADTGGGHRASAEALAKQFLLQYPGSSYELADLWTDHGVLPYRTLVSSYKHLSAHPRQWRWFYFLSNNKLNEVPVNVHSRFMCGRAIKNRIKSFDPDVVVSVHPTMNYCPLQATRTISKELGKHIPFFTVVTDLGSAHITWFQKKVDKLYVASDRLYKLARRLKGTPAENIVLTGLPIRHGFAVRAEEMGDRTSDRGKEYQKATKMKLAIDDDKPMVLVMGGGEGVGSLSEIVDEMFIKLTQQGVNATICVVCGRNEVLKERLATRDWDALLHDTVEAKPAKRRGLFRFLRRRKKTEQDVEMVDPDSRGHVDVVGLGYVTNMPDYMVAADVLVSKAGPGTIAEAASIGLPIMLTSFLPGQEAGNVDVVLESGFGAYCEDPKEIGTQVGHWLQDADLMKSMSHAATKAGNPYAANEICLGHSTVHKQADSSQCVAPTRSKVLARRLSIPACSRLGERTVELPAMGGGFRYRVELIATRTITALRSPIDG